MREYRFEIYICDVANGDSVEAAYFEDSTEALDNLVWLNDHGYDAYLKTYSWFVKENKENDS